jgi:hypothetical protein
MSASPGHSFVSSHGFGTLALKSSVISVPYYGVSKLTIGSGREPFGNATFRNWNSSLTTLAGTCENNFRYHPEYSGDGFSFYSLEQQVTPINVTLNVVNIEVAAY